MSACVRVDLGGSGSIQAQREDNDGGICMYKYHNGKENGSSCKSKRGSGTSDPGSKADQRRLWNGLVRTGCGQSFSGAADRYGTDRNRGLL